MGVVDDILEIFTNSPATEPEPKSRQELVQDAFAGIATPIPFAAAGAESGAALGERVIRAVRGLPISDEAFAESEIRNQIFDTTEQTTSNATAFADTVGPSGDTEAAAISRKVADSTDIPALLELSQRAGVTPLFEGRGNSIRIGVDAGARPGFSRSNRSIAELAKEREAIRRQLLIRSEGQKDLIGEIFKSSDQPQARAAALQEFIAQQKTTQDRETLANQAEAILFQLFGGDTTKVTRVLNNIRQVAESDAELEEVFKRIVDGSLRPVQ